MCEPKVRRCWRCKRFFHVGWIAYHNCLFWQQRNTEEGR